MNRFGSSGNEKSLQAFASPVDSILGFPLVDLAYALNGPDETRDFTGRRIDENNFGSSSNARFTFARWATSPVSVVPVPAAVWLFGTALLGLVGFSKRKSRIAA